MSAEGWTWLIPYLLVAVILAIAFWWGDDI